MVVVVGVRGRNGQAWEWWQCIFVDGSVMEWIGEGGSTWWGGRRVCHGVDRGGGSTWWSGRRVCHGVDRGG